MDISVVGAIIVIVLGVVACATLMLFDRWLRNNNVKTRFVPSLSGIMFLLATVFVAARIALILEPEDATLLVGVLAIASIGVLATAVECSAIDE